MLASYLTKQSTHAPAATMNNFGSPVAAIGPDGKPTFIVTDRSGAVMPLPGVRPPLSAAEQQAEREKSERSRQGQQMLSVMAQARTLLQSGNPTGSGVGAAVDAAGRVVGYSPPSAQAAGQLEALSGWLVANVPRMEGPQSNFDVQNYMTMAGKVGMRDVPVAERLAALKVVEDLQRKYAAINTGKGAEAAPTAAPGLPSMDAIEAELRRRQGK